MYTEILEKKEKFAGSNLIDMKMLKILHHIWRGMMARCYEPDFYQGNYKHYGARGITVDPEWHNFDNFYKDMSPRPSDEMQLDRIDNDGPYSKENCKWSTPSENSRNRRNTRYIETHEGKLVKAELLQRIGWTKEQFRWFEKSKGIEWIVEGYKNGTLPDRINVEIDREDIVGLNFGEWKVLSFESYIRKDGHLYHCECRCGTKKLIPRDNLRKGKTTRCRSCAAKDQWMRQKSA